MARGTKRKTAASSRKTRTTTNTTDTTTTTAAASASSPSTKRGKKSSSNNSSTENAMFSSSSKKAKGSASSASSALNKANNNNKSPPLSPEAAIEKLFLEFADADDPTIISMEGISKLCDQLDIDPLEDIRVLVLLWKLVDAPSTEKPGQITKAEFTTGCARLHLTSIDKLQALLPSLDTGFLDQKEFREFYKFCFQFNRQGTHRTLDHDMVLALLQLVLHGRVSADRLETFGAFLEQSTASYSRITLDQWTSFLDFCVEYDDDLSTYDESTSAWPVMMDEYVEFMMKKGATTTTTTTTK